MADALPQKKTRPAMRTFLQICIVVFFIAAFLYPGYVFFSLRGGIGILWRTEIKTLVYLLFPLCGLYAFFFVWSQIIVGANLRALTKLFRGALAVHRVGGIVAILFAFLHPLFIVIGLGLAKYMQYKFVSPSLFPYVIVGYVQLSLMILTVGAALLRRTMFLRKHWRKIHVLNYVVFVLVWTHSWFLGSDVRFTTLKYLWVFFAATAVISFVLRILPVAPDGKRKGIRAALLAIILFLALAAGFTLWQKDHPQPVASSQPTPVNVSAGNEQQNAAAGNEQAVQPNENVAEENKTTPLPPSMNLDVPFTVQAPYSNWAEPWQDACEEASILMVHYFYQGKPLSKEIAKNEILAMVQWQEKNWGGHFDLPAEKIAELAREFYGYTNVDVRTDITIDDLKREVADGRPVIVPAAGRMLGNPYFTQPGPIYHNLVVKGYTATRIITNDEGVGRGHNYEYAPDVLMNAIHDYVKGNMAAGKKAMIVIHNNS